MADGSRTDAGRGHPGAQCKDDGAPAHTVLGNVVFGRAVGSIKSSSSQLSNRNIGPDAVTALLLNMTTLRDDLPRLFSIIESISQSSVFFHIAVSKVYASKALSCRFTYIIASRHQSPQVAKRLDIGLALKSA